jgi:uncharacterized protein
MAKLIRITAGAVSMLAELKDSVTATKIWDSLPIEARGSTWGDEIYFAIRANCDYEDAQEVVEIGDLAYWPPGSAFCIFFGPTPASVGSEVRPASAVNVFGRLQGDAKAFKAVPNGERVVIEQELSE